MLILPMLAAACTLASSADVAPTVLTRARHVLGLDASNQQILRLNMRDVTAHAFESDRMYPPYLAFVDDHLLWVDASTGIVRDSLSGAFGQRAVIVSDDHGATGSNAFWATVERDRALEPRIVVRAWSAAPDVHTLGRCTYRDYSRIVLARQGTYGEERLFVDPKSGFPVKLDRMEPQYLWGDVHVEYVYTTWLLYGGNGFGAGDILVPTTTVRMVDGEAEITRTLVDAAQIPRDSSPSLAMPDSGRVSTVELPLFLHPAPLDTIRVGPQTFILANRGYNEVVSLVQDTVYVLDATQSETRARADSEWIGRLFPGRHPVALVVTDLAWPHVSGMRFWVASGATVISRDMSRPFLEKVVARRWTLHPDKLESLHPRPTLHFRAVHDSLALHDVGVYAIDGMESEGALMVYLARDGVLWGSDYVQSLRTPTLYATEVFNAACRHRITPTRVVAEHQKLADWSSLVNVVGRQQIADYPMTCAQAAALR